MELSFSGEIWQWRGPAPHHFVSVPEAECEEIADAAALVTYGWGMIPARITLGATTWDTSLWPKDGGYIVPIKLAVRRAEEVDVGDVVSLRLAIGE
ncbi:DUF1905 domain-containing protein [Nocardioides sp. R-C-SC26]|uniref:DUF1905 domain-containing protein n=1 Tax=Nocardioides sp. R-C-SC26 TaxID=2870414 RepID=UPI001E4C8C56|nr:DUF1905 domain-containing protein [Nocardioides sp. R-C-SC26]